MLCKTYCATCIGLQVVTVTVEVFITPGIGIHIVGLPDVAVKESLLRVVTALSNFGFRVPGKKIVINLAPADIRKEGSAFDLSIAIALLCAMDQIPTTYLNDYVIMGELSLDGMIRPVTGALPVAIHAKENGFKGCIFPKDSATEASEISELEIYGVSNIGMVIEVLNGRADEEWRIKYRSDDCSERKRCVNDFSNVKGQKYAKRGLEIAAAGGHNLLLIGSPGCGKSLMASCFPSILPQMSREESLET
ncbi:MAG: ATP-binding protein, partial [Bacteroidales bacterium]|nr:ATP-binding protein [Bacteroidales bacterium]